MAALFALNAPVAAQGRPATIDIEIYKASFIVGVEGGSGTLNYRGRTYGLSVAGASLGLSVGASRARLSGVANNIHNVADIEGIYRVFQVGGAVGNSGSKVLRLQNAKGVELVLSGQQVGLEFSVDVNGLQISLK